MRIITIKTIEEKLNRQEMNLKKSYKENNKNSRLVYQRKSHQK